MATQVKKILIADDEEDLRLLVQVTLENPAYDIVTAVDGLSALHAIQSQLPDLVILDWMMPGLNGCQVLDQLRQNPHTAQIPVVMLTAMDERESRELVRGLGLAGFLMKPFSPLELIHTVREVLA